MERQHGSGEQLRFPETRRKEQYLPRSIGLQHPVENRAEALIIIVCKAIVQEERERIAAELQQIGSGKTKGEIDLVNGTCARLLERNQLSRGV